MMQRVQPTVSDSMMDCKGHNSSLYVRSLSQQNNDSVGELISSLLFV